MGFSHVGTIRKDSEGWCTTVEFTQKKRPKRMPRGTYRIGVWRDHPEVVALSWMDTKPVRFFGTGCSTRLAEVKCRERDGSLSVVPCPRLMRDYHKAMGGSRHTRSTTAAKILYSTGYLDAKVLQDDISWISGLGLGKRIHRSQARSKTPQQTGSDSRRIYETPINGTTEPNERRLHDLVGLVTEQQPRHPHMLEKTEEMNGAKRRQWLCKVCSVW
ncbi:Hypothetical protein PHPALM_8908 [Phytophthora palmivora]|uniref:PiggyBac transposable element-derived protein domain-containing protein n=1 Tax=Phytophthora palmivora TaxID=4796 RepID=A0A2P4Y8N0_9STRA|nr:Hypothetical protein PHPALM_8908 [Phytophthora palmivora]